MVKPPPHPAKWIVRAYLAFAAVFALFAAWSFASAAIGSGVFGAAAAIFAVWAWWKVDGQLDGVQLGNLAGQELSRGRFEEAAALHARIPPRAYFGSLPRAIALQRTLIATYRGKTEDAIREATAATDPRLGIFQHQMKRAQRAQGFTHRAIAWVARGEAAKAEADAAEAEAIAEAPADALARARLVRVLLLSRAGKHDDVAAMLASHAHLLNEHLAPFERSLARAVARMTQRRRRSPYREPGKVEEPRARGRVAEFIAQIAPDAASFADERDELATRGERPLEAPPEDVRAMHAIAAGRAAAIAKRPARATARRALVLWVVLIVLFLGIWQLLTPASAPTHASDEPSASSSAIAWMILYAPAAFLGTFATLLAVSLARTKRLNGHLARAARASALGDVAAARAAYGVLANGRLASIAAAAELELAKLASRDVDFGAAIASCERGIARIGANATVRATSSDILLPSLFGELAVAKAAAGRIAEADTELAMLMKNHPMFALLASTHLRVRLVRAARSGDRAACAAVARERTAEMPMPRREELLGDLAIAAEYGASPEVGAGGAADGAEGVMEAERARLADELADPSVAKWIDAVAPGLRDAALAGPRARVAEEDHEIEEEGSEVAKAARRL